MAAWKAERQAQSGALEPAAEHDEEGEALQAAMEARASGDIELMLSVHEQYAMRDASKTVSLALADLRHDMHKLRGGQIRHDRRGVQRLQHRNVLGRGFNQLYLLSVGQVLCGGHGRWHRWCELYDVRGG